MKKEEKTTSTSSEAFKEANLTGTTSNDTNQDSEVSAKEVKNATNELNPDENSMNSRG